MIQQEQLNAELPKHLALCVTTLALWENLRLLGDKWTLSIMLIFGASRIAFGSVNAHCIPHIASGLMYINDR